VGNGTPGEIDLEQLTVNKVAASKIVYVHKDYAGKADIVLLDDVTGDQYEYGFLKFTAGAESGDPGDWSYSKQPDTVCVKNSAHPNGSTALVTTEKLKNNAAYRIASSLDTATDALPPTGSLCTAPLGRVKCSAFDMDSETLTTTDAVFPISRDVLCYNDATDSWSHPPMRTTILPPSTPPVPSPAPYRLLRQVPRRGRKDRPGGGRLTA
jgi:hypothetical protein